MTSTWAHGGSPEQPASTEAILLAALGTVARLPITDGDPHPMLIAFADLAVQGVEAALGASVLLGDPAEPSLLLSTDRIAQAAAASALLREHVAVGDLRRQLRQMHDALDARALIEQAKGILMGRYGRDADGAFAELSRRSQTSDVKVREVARRLIADTGRVIPPDQDDTLPAGTGPITP